MQWATRSLSYVMHDTITTELHGRHEALRRAYRTNTRRHHDTSLGDFTEEFVIETLLDEGADVSVLTNTYPKKSLLMSPHLTPATAQLLLSRGAGCMLNFTNEEGKNCLSYVKRPDTLGFLIEIGVPVTTEAFCGYLSVNLHDFNIDCVRLFLETNLLIRTEVIANPSYQQFVRHVTTNARMPWGQSFFMGVGEMFEAHGYGWPRMLYNGEMLAPIEIEEIGDL